ncbi:MAG TPA: TIGR04255 family protein [Hymenobacter sp.]|jgi:uncharacterized protein (TIGR04255 family)
MTHAPLPIRINPHALLAALVAVSYTPQSSADQTREAFRQVLQQAGFTDESNLMAALGAKLGTPDVLFRNQGVSVQLQASAIVFNGVLGKKAGNDTAAEPADEYIEWARYFPVIQHVLTLLHNTGAASDFPHTAVRYINALPGLPLNDQLRVKLPSLGSLPVPDSALYRATFAEVRIAENGPVFEVELSLADQQRVAGRTGKQSVFDVTVRAPTSGLNLDALLRHIDEAHTCEKQVFFGLLEPGYLDSLQPVYR